ncbi:DUF4240 domain-containing protein [Streptomyces sp. NPDC058691]|uniref:DUF4240 domain-containing protein n=1 Tax=Streptomyces sp. NPDC058691 TaxID=3346601 RepID=UPI003659A777
MDTGRFRQLIHDARSQVPDPADPDAVAARASGLLAEQSPERILAAQQAPWDLMAASYRAPLWAAAHLINGGCSGDGFDYFRGRLILQGRETFDRAVAWDAYLSVTGEELPADAFTIRYPDLDPASRFDFGDTAATARRLPALAAL